MSRRLPKGWIEDKLITIIGHNGLMNDGDWIESKDQDPQGEIRLIQLADIGEIVFLNKSCRYLTKETAITLKCTYLKKGDILVARMPSPLGRACIFPKLDQKCITAVDVCIIRPSVDTINNKLLCYFINSSFIREKILSQATGTTRKRISRKKLERLVIPLPPLNEQKRIVAKLDTIMPRVEAVKERLERIPNLIKRFRQSVLTAAVTGKLTEKWREQHPDVESAEVLLDKLQEEREKKYKEECEKAKKEKKKKPKAYFNYINRKINIEIPDCWETIPTSKLFYFVTSGSRGWAKYYNKTGAIFIRITNLNYNTLNIDLSSNNIKRVRIPQKIEGKRTKLERGDFLFSITGDVGMVAIAPNNIEESYVNQHIALARPINGFSKKFIGYFFLSRSGGLGQLKTLQKGVTKAGLGLDDIVNVLVPLPPLEEQKEIVRQVDKLFAFANKLEAHYQKAKEKILKLPQSILAKAFRGELVPQDPKEEPAHILLEKIKAQKENKQKLLRGAQGGGFLEKSPPGRRRQKK